MPDVSAEFINFRILDGKNTSLDSNYIHVGRAENLYEASKNRWSKDETYTVVITDGDEVMDIYTGSASFHIITTDLSLINVVNSIAELADEYNRMSSLRRHLTVTTEAADSLIEGASKTMNADCFYLTTRFRVISCWRTINCPELMYLEPGTYVETRDLAEVKDEWITYGDWTVRLAPVEYQGAINSYILIVLRKDSRNRFNSEMLQILVSCMSDFIEQSVTDRAVTSGRFTKFAHDIIDGSITTQEALTERLRNIPAAPSGNFYLIVVETEQLLNTIPSDIFPIAGALFPNSFPVQYDNRLLLIVPADKHGNMVNYNEQELMGLLSEYHLFACIGNLTVSLRSLRADYLKVSKCLGFARTFCSEKDRRFFRAEEYAMYDVIDICCNALTDQFHGDTIRLCNRGILTLFNYDKQHGTDYTEILRKYLLNCRNTSKTAEELEIHRNTLMYKLNKIEWITGEDLNDPMISFRLLFSLFTIDYLDMYQNRRDIEPEAYTSLLKGKKRDSRK